MCLIIIIKISVNNTEKMQVGEQVDWLHLENECMNNIKFYISKNYPKRWSGFTPEKRAAGIPFALYDTMFCGSHISVHKLKARLSATTNAPSITETGSACMNGVFNFGTPHCGKACYHFHRISTVGVVLFTVTSGCCVEDFAKHLPHSFPLETTRLLSHRNTTQILHLIGRASDLLPDEHEIWLDILPRFISVGVITKPSQCHMDGGPYVAVTVYI
jgi:hypothetical protein